MEDRESTTASRVPKESPRRPTSKRTILVGAIAIILIVGLAVVVFAVPFEFTETYEDTETYYENEPYEVTETYYENEPYEVTEPVSYEIKETGCEPNFWDTYQNGWVTLRNTDDVGGTFQVEFRFYNVNGLAKRPTQSYWIASGESHKFTFGYDKKWLEDIRCEHTVTCPTKTVTRIRQVEKTRIVTRVRQVPKTKTVTRTRTVKKTIWQRYFEE